MAALLFLQLSLLSLVPVPLPPPPRAATISPEYVELETGVRMQSFHLPPAADGPLYAEAPIIFVHGTFHAGWCWVEHWMPYFAQQGLDCHAISLRGTSGSPVEQKAVKCSEHAADLEAFVRQRLGGAAPILIGHSFGGATVLKYLERGGAARSVALVCSVPPSGNGPMTMRFLRRSWRQALLITRGFALKTATVSADDARGLFLEPTFPEETLQAFLPRFQADSRVGLDLSDFNRNLPARCADAAGKATWLSQSDALSEALPTLVLGAENDFVVDREAVQETATFLGTDAMLLSELPHDVMLCGEWKVTADKLLAWITSFRLSS